ncbi:hypothetical protein [Streptomyces sp. 8N616]|uniref:hypothetical protein n=1 Tax=Streptomyces sp. 8N616 TaxID=3457414 RepID=UPI003FD1FC00
MRLRLRTVLTALALFAGALSQTQSATAAPATDPLAACDQRSDKAPRCVTATAKLDRAPAVGGTAALSVTVSSKADVPGARIHIDLPNGLTWAAEPTGFTTGKKETTQPDEGGSVTRASRSTDLDRGQSLRFTGKVTAAAAGDYAIRVRVLPPSGYGLGTEQSALLTVGKTAANSRLGLDSGPYATAHLPAGTKVGRQTTLPAPKLGGLAVPDSASATAAAALSCVRGSFSYTDRDGNWQSSVNLQVQVWDEDPANSDDLLTVGLTDANGRYRLCFDNSTDARGGQDVYLRFVTQNGQWGVERDDDPWTFRTGQRDNLGDGTTTDFGDLSPADRRLDRSLRVYDVANTASAWTPGDCWDSRDPDCERIDFNWEPGQTEGTFFRPGEDEIYLIDQDADDRNVVAHELGHAVMDDLYDDNDFETNCGSDHQAHKQETEECAWSEGFGDWYGVAVFNDPVYRDTVDQNINVDFDAATWGSVRTDMANDPWDNGDRVEGRIAGALWDLVDGGDEAFDDYNDTLDNVWYTFLDDRPHTFHDWWTERGGNGKETGEAALGALYQNTIDYDFRDRLADHVSLSRPTPLVDHNYRFDTTKIFWSVVTLRPPANTDYDLSLYEDSGLSNLLASSVHTGDATDFVAINSNRRDLGDYYPQVRRPGGTGTGDYRIEGDETEGLLADTQTITMGANRLAAVWDVCLSAQQDVTLTVTPSAGSQDAELYVLSADSGGSDNVANRTDATASSTGHGAGDAEQLTVSLGDGCHGVVVVNRAGSGSYTITRS